MSARHNVALLLLATLRFQGTGKPCCCLPRICLQLHAPVRALGMVGSGYLPSQ